MLKKLLLSLSILTSALFADGFTLKSNSFSGQMANSQVFNGFGCTGDNISPDLSWENAPKGTKSFAIMMYDKDAPTGSGWWHWVVFDIPSKIVSLKENAGDMTKKLLPSGAKSVVSDFGVAGYGGACPPVGDSSHQYIITIYALDVEKLGLDENAKPALVGFMLNSHTIQKASVISYYGR